MKIILFFLLISFNLLFAQNNNLEKIKLQLQWKYQFQFAGFIIAKEKGYYQKVGLDVDILEYQNSNIIKDLEENKIDFALNNSLLAYKNNKLNKVSLLATYFQRSPLIIITQPEVKSILDLKGKSLMISQNNRYNSSLSILLDYFNLNSENTTFLDPSFNLNDFIEKKVDAVTAFRSNELFVLDQKNIPYNIIDPVEHGFSTNAINLFASHEKIKNHPDQIASFLDATKKGWIYALDNIEETAKLIHEKYQPNKSVEHLIYEGKVTKQLMLTDLYDIGEINTQFIKKTYKQLINGGKLDSTEPSDKLYFIPKRSDISYIQLTQEEKNWIAKNPEVTYSEVNWKPLSIIDENRMKGIMGDYLDLVSSRTGINFKYIPSKSWPEVLEQFEKGNIDLVPGVGSSPQELALGSVSKMYAQYPMVIVTDDKFTYIDNLTQMENKTIAVPKHYTSYNFIVKNFPNIKLITTENIPEALLLVQQQKADAFVGHIATSLYYMSELHLKTLKVSGMTQFNFEHHYLIQNDNPRLLSIINKVFDSISYQDRRKIYSKWIQPTQIEKQVDYTLTVTVAVFLLAIILLIIFWMLKLKYEVQKRKESEELLRVTNKKLNGLFSLSPLGIALTDMQGNYIEFNKAFEKICGYSKEELQALSYWDLTPTEYENEEQKQLDSLFDTGFYGPYEKEYIQKDGTAISINLNGMLIENENGEQFIWSIVEDITARKKSEKTLMEQSKLAAMGEMIGNIAHQWRQPLSIISTGATGLKVEKEYNMLTDEKFYKMCDSINNNAQYLSKTIDDFKNFIKGDRQKTQFNLEENLESFLHLLEGTIKTNQIELIKDIDEEIIINGYPNELIQCFINIFNNAKDVLKEKEDQKYFFIKAVVEDNSIIIKLTDNAGGIPKEILSHVFEPYFTTKHKSQGTGLGLSMTYNLIVEGMKGKIEVNNVTYSYKEVEYTGAEFTIVLPLD